MRIATREDDFDWTPARNMKQAVTILSSHRGGIRFIETELGIGVVATLSIVACPACCKVVGEQTATAIDPSCSLTIKRLAVIAVNQALCKIREVYREIERGAPCSN